MTDANPRPPGASCSACGARVGLEHLTFTDPEHAYCGTCLATYRRQYGHEPPAAGAAGFGEPWVPAGLTVHCVYSDGMTRSVALAHSAEHARRIAACVNALAGLADPERDIQELRAALEWALHHAGNVCALADRNDPDKAKLAEAKALLARIDARCAGGGAEGEP